MIQRIQTLYLLVVAIIAGIGLFWNFGDTFSLIILVGVILLSFISIFSFRKRQNQFVINRINILCNLILLGVFSWRMLHSSGESLLSEKGVQLVVPIISIVFLYLANLAIHRDEELVKSADRLRYYRVTLCVFRILLFLGRVGFVINFYFMKYIFTN